MVFYMDVLNDEISVCKYNMKIIMAGIALNGEMEQSDVLDILGTFSDQFRCLK